MTVTEYGWYLPGTAKEGSEGSLCHSGFTVPAGNIHHKRSGQMRKVTVLALILTLLATGFAFASSESEVDSITIHWAQWAPADYLQQLSAGFTEETLDNALDFQGGGDLPGAARKLLRHGTAAFAFPLRSMNWSNSCRSSWRADRRLR